LAVCFRDRRLAKLIKHELAALEGQRGIATALGYEDPTRRVAATR